MRLTKPYKVEDFRNNTTFVTALNNGVPPQDLEEQFKIYDAWNGFNYGIVNDILSRDQHGEPRHISLFLYYQQENGVWLMYSLKHGIPVFVDFHVKFITLVHKSSAPDYVSGNVS